MQNTFFCTGSKYVMEFKMSMNDWSIGHKLEVNLSQCQLSTLYYSNRLALVQEVDLSDNELVDYSLSALASLQLCQRLSLNGNKLTSLSGFPHLPALKQLNVANNELVSQTGIVIANLKKASLISLEEIVLENNPCHELIEIQDLINDLNILK